MSGPDVRETLDTPVAVHETAPGRWEIAPSGSMGDPIASRMEIVNSSSPPIDEAPVAISVVIATYNRLDSLLWLLDDLNGQTDVRGVFDVTVVDDGSEVPVESEIGARPTGFACRVIRRVNGGPGVARDTGISASTGRIIVILDDDMVIPPTFLAGHQRKHDAGAAVVLGHIRAPKSSRLPLFERFHQRTLDRFVESYARGEAVAEGVRLCTGNVSFSREAYENVGGFDLGLRRCEDRDIGIRFEQAGYRFAFTDEGWSEHRSDHEDVLTWRKRSSLYGELDTRIAAKFPTVAKVNPWEFLFKLPKLSLPFLGAAALFPSFGHRLAAKVYDVAKMADHRQLERVAMLGASLCYGTEYYSGVGEALLSRGGRRAVLKSLRNHVRLRKSPSSVTGQRPPVRA
jgi:GT2 family glycosyltransferase